MPRDTPDQVDRDEQTLALRDEGRSFAGIAQILGLDNGHAANVAFNRALRCRSKAHQEWLRSREMMRLDAVASCVRARDDLSVKEVIRRLRGVKHQRLTLFRHPSL